MRNIRALCVDDNSINLITLELLFDSYDSDEYKIIITKAEDGQSAINIVANSSEPFDILLMDIQMPVMDGYKTTQNIRKIPEYANIPVIYLSCSHPSEIARDNFKDKLDEFISKPFDFNVLVSTVIKMSAYNI